MVVAGAQPILPDGARIARVLRYPVAPRLVNGELFLVQSILDDNAEKVEEFRAKFASPYIAAQRGFVDEIIEPRLTRKKLITGLSMLENKRDTNPARKHGNIPL